MASDNNGVEMLAVTLYSTIKNNIKDNINIFIIHTDISATNQKEVCKLESIRKNINIKFYKIDNSFFSDVELTNQTVSMPAYYRYFAPDILKNEDRVLYMDFDMLCIDSLSHLYNIDMQDNYIAAVEDYYVSSTGDYPGFKAGIRFNSTDVYYNSGLLLMDLNKLRTSGIMDVFWRNIRNKTKIIPKKYNIFADQTITNITFKNKILQLDYRYNAVVSVFKYRHLDNPAIIHFSGRDKPFTCYDDFSAKYSDIYYDYYVECMSVLGRDASKLLKNAMRKLGLETNNAVDNLKISQKLAKDKSNNVQELLKKLEEEKKIKEEKIKELEDHIYIMENSKSWKITKPIRNIKELKTKIKK